MADCQHHGGCGHDHLRIDLGPEDNLFSFIDRVNVVALNAIGEGSTVIKPWSERLEESQFLDSDSDDQLILRIPFNGSVRLKSILLKCGPSEQTPSQVTLFANEPDLDFEDVGHKVPAQEIHLAESREVGEYSLKTVRFSNISGITLFFPTSRGAESCRIYYVGFLGHWSLRNEKPVITVYESQPNIVDHEKIQGMDGTFSSFQH